LKDREADLLFCNQLGSRGFRPSNVMEISGYTLEFVSYPFPGKGGIFINARTVKGDPTSMATFKFVSGELVKLP